MTQAYSAAPAPARDSLFVAAMPWLFVLIWSTGFIVAKYGMPYAEPITFLFLRYTGFDQHGHTIDRIAEGFHARVVQHECDHLQGVLYPMRVKDFTRFGFTEILFPELPANHDD